MASNDTEHWRIPHLAMRIELGHDQAVITTESTVSPSPDAPGTGTGTGTGTEPLRLDGVGLTLVEITVDGQPLRPDDYELDDRTLVLHLGVGAHHTVRTVATVAVRGAGAKGLCTHAGIVHTNLEPEGFRRLTWALDRPEHRATYDVTLVGDPTTFPVMLANGEPAGEGTTSDGRHFARFVDPVPKPSYLFACVAGQLETVAATHTTRRGRQVELRVVAPPDMIDGAGFALGRMADILGYDEQVSGVEHDLDSLSFVAVPGYPDATEYHGLMFFDPSLLIADGRGHTDDDLMLIMLNCAHEYGHHVRGNRVTVRRWDQLALKEGLTVLMGQNGYREHWLGPAARVLDVLDLRRTQFPEEVTIGAPVVRDSGVDPSSLYTRTTYLKGAEIFRMLRVVLGEDRWAAAFAEFVTRFDLDAASVDDFVGIARSHAARATPTTAPAVGPEAVDAVARWFRLAGRPAVSVAVDPADGGGGAVLHLRRTDGLTDDPALGIPMELAFLDDAGHPLAVSVDGAAPSDRATVVLQSREGSYRLLTSGAAADRVAADRPILVSPLRGYSAPVDLTDSSTSEHLAVRVVHETDAFARFWAAETLMTRAIDAFRSGDEHAAADHVGPLATALSSVLRTERDPLMLAQLLALPDEFALGDRDPQIDVDGVASGLDFLRKRLGAELAPVLFDVLDRFPATPSGATAADLTARWLVEPVLALALAHGDDDAVTVARRLVGSPDTTQAMRALAQLAHLDRVDLEPLLADTYERWRGSPKLVDRWIRVQSGARRHDTVERVRRLVGSDLYDRADRGRVMAVWFPFATRNRSAFHQPSGDGYRAFVDEVITLMPVRPDWVIRIVGDVLQFRRFDPHRRDLLRTELERLADAPGMPDFAVGIVRGLLQD